MTIKIDLTLKLSKNHPVFKRMSKSTESFWNTGHVGTHLDIMGDYEIPLDHMYSQGKIVDVSHIRDRDIGPEDLDGISIEKNDFVLFYTNFMQEFEYGEPAYFSRHPELSMDLVADLIAKKVRFIGIDAAGVRRGKEHKDVDQLCADQGIFIIENLTNLNRIPQGQDFQVTCLWLYREGMTGIPCRVVAETPAI